MAKLRLSPTALEDLERIKGYISKELSNPVSAENVVRRIIRDYKRLEDNPFLGPSLSTKVPFETDFRYLVSGRYIIVYKATVQVVSIYNIFYGGQDYIKTLFGEEYAEETIHS